MAIYDRLPDRIDADARYVVYSHGLIVEGDDETPVSPEFGRYDFPAIRRALFDGGGFNLIAPHRPKDADYGQYVDTLVSWVRQLLRAGVRPGRITLVGFSRGGQMTASASSRLASEHINTALIAICSNGDFVRDPPLIPGRPPAVPLRDLGLGRVLCGARGQESSGVVQGDRHLHRKEPRGVLPAPAGVDASPPGVDCEHESLRSHGWLTLHFLATTTRTRG